MAFRKPTSGAAALGMAMLAGCELLALPAKAAYVVTIEEVGSDVVATGSGSINFDALDFWGDEEDPSLIEASEGALVIGPAIPTDDIYYSGIAGPAVAFGGGDEFFADSGSGAVVGLGTFEETTGGVIAVPEDAVSGAPLGISTATFANATLMSLGLTPGSYQWTWGSGPTADRFTLEIATERGASAVPEPGTWAMLLLGLAGFMTLRTRGRSGSPATVGGGSRYSD
jgi:PEP-CTERM motif